MIGSTGDRGGVRRLPGGGEVEMELNRASQMGFLEEGAQRYRGEGKVAGLGQQGLKAWLWMWALSRAGHLEVSELQSDLEPWNAEVQARPGHGLPGTLAEAGLKVGRVEGGGALRGRPEGRRAGSGREGRKEL